MASNAATSRSVGAASEEAVEEVADDAAAVGFDLPIRTEKDLEELESRLRLMPMCKKSLVCVCFGKRSCSWLCPLKK